MDVNHVISILQRLGIKFSAGEPMSRHTSFKIGGAIDVMIFPESISEIDAAVTALSPLRDEMIIVGNGTNLLFTDKAIHKIALKTFDGLSNLEPEGDNGITCDSGVLLSRAASLARNMELTGMEFAHGIPGTLGGAITMNAGAYGGQMSDIISSVTFLDENGHKQRWGKDKLDFSYRHSVFCDNDYIILSASLEMERGKAGEIQSKMELLNRKRRDSQPLNLPSAGSTFKRPQSGYAAALIEQAGLKGYKIGGAQVSEKHAGFVVNVDNASFDDVFQLIEHIKRTVLEKFGTQLVPEVKIIH